METLLVLGMVFLAVLISTAVFVPVFFSGLRVPAPRTSGRHTADNPVSRFIEPENLQKMRYSAALIAVILGLAFLIVLDFLWGFPAVIALAAVAYYLPWWFIQRKIRKRNQEFEAGMLDFTILIANSLRAGIALPGAIEMAVQTIGGAIRDEFTVVLGEHRLGMDLAESIERLTKRIDSENLQLFSATVCVTMRTGGSMAEVLEQVVATIRQRSAFQDKLKTMIAQSEFEAYAMALSPLAAFILFYLLDRKLMMPMLTTGIGWCSILAVILLEVIGFVIIRHVTKVKF